MCDRYWAGYPLVRRYRARSCKSLAASFWLAKQYALVWGNPECARFISYPVFTRRKGFNSGCWGKSCLCVYELLYWCNICQRVKKYLKSHGVKDGLWYDPNGRHGQALLVGAQGINKVLEWIKDNSYTKNWWTLTHITPYPTTSYTLMVNPIVGHDLMSDMSYWMMIIQQKIEVYPAFYPDIKKNRNLFLNSIVV